MPLACCTCGVRFRLHVLSVMGRLLMHMAYRTYPGQSGINPLPMDWGHKDPQERGPVVVSRGQTTIRRRNGK